MKDEEKKQKKLFSIGDLVKLKKLVDYDGNAVVKYDNVYYISEVKGDKITLITKNDKFVYKFGVFNAKNIEIVTEERR